MGNEPFGTEMGDAMNNGEKLQQGSSLHEYTAPYVSPGDAKKQLVPLHNLTDILFVTGGYCGSSCDTFSRSTWAAAKLHSQRSVRFVTWGGLGGSAAQAKQTLTATSFQGGSIDSSGGMDILGNLMNNLGRRAIMSILAGYEEPKTESLRIFMEAAVAFIPKWANKGFQITKEQLTRKAFGPSFTVPAEYLQIPPDVYLPNWYDVGSDDGRWHVIMDAAKALAP